MKFHTRLKKEVKGGGMIYNMPRLSNDVCWYLLMFVLIFCDFTVLVI